MAKILLIYPQPDEIKRARFGYSLTLLYLASVLGEEHQCVYKDFSWERFERKDVAKLIDAIDLVIVECDSVTLKRSTNIHNGEQLIRAIKEVNPKLPIICVGKDIALFPRAISGASVCCVGEPEKVIERVIKSLLNEDFEMLKHTTGLYVAANGKAFCTGKAELIEDLDTLPFPCRTLLPKSLEFGVGYKSALIETSRGCEARCIFCQRRGWSEGRFRPHSVDYVLKEFDLLHKHGYKNIWITDDNFSFHLSRAKQILALLGDRGLTKGMKIALSSWANVDKEFLQIAKYAGVSIVSFGVESANKEILKFYKKHINLKTLKELVEYADSLGLYCVGNFIIGAPMESEKTINETFLFAEETPFDQVNVKILNYIAGSLLFEGLPSRFKNERTVFACKENGLNNFGLEDLKKKIWEFKKKFYDNRKMKIAKKISLHGPPFFENLKGSSRYHR